MARNPTRMPMPGDMPFQPGPGLGAPNVSIRQPPASKAPPVKAVNMTTTKIAAPKQAKRVTARKGRKGK
jgi:hypothetical protein